MPCFLERFGNCEMEWAQESVVELIELYNRKEIIWGPKHPTHFNSISDYNIILNFFRKPQTIIFVSLYVILQFFNMNFTHFRHDASDCLLGNFEEVLQANIRITTCQVT